MDDLPEVSAARGDWPWWRGPTRNNAAAIDQDPPIAWGETDHVAWRVKVPGRGHGTPCLWGDRIFLATGQKQEQTISMLCFDRDSGDKLWETTLYDGELPKIHDDNSHASATVACDGQRVFFPYQTVDAVRMAALDLDGNIVWDKHVAPYESVQGYSASPTIFKSAVIVPTDASPDVPSKLTALHRKTGQVVWQVPRPDKGESYASALAIHVAGRDQLLIIGVGQTRSYDPNDGKPLWHCQGPADYDAATVAFDEHAVYATGGYPRVALLGIRADGTGDVTETHRVWKSDAKAGYVPSPLLHDGLLYAVSDRKGLMRCYDAASGEVVWEHTLEGMFYSSPVSVGERIYLFDRDKGKGYVMKAGRRFELLAENTLPDGAFATPVISGGRIYLRTLGDFYCLGEKQ
ncbi:MAG: PQQ-binding-like beta-propeller repeat protein [Candidatus Nealsonbacteria bacterium]|nr:PQQ-binding-like beta-propeller repeat protein [Candidatus Nealsonbacteria bacterium]